MKVRLLVDVEPDLIEDLQALADKQDRSRAWLIRTVLERHVEKEKKDGALATEVA